MPEPLTAIARVNPRKLPDTLKEGIADAVLTSLTHRLSGVGEHGGAVFGTRPRNAFASGFLVPQSQLTDGDEVTASIRISGHGIDLLVAAALPGPIHVQPSAALYVRVFPTAQEIREHPNCDPKFTLRKQVEVQRRTITRDREREELSKLPKGRKDPKWPEISFHIRKAIHQELGIPFDAGHLDEPDTESAEGISDSAPDDPQEVAPSFSGRTNLPDHLANEAAVPQKWHRLELALPPFEFHLDRVGLAVAAANKAIELAISDRLKLWAADTSAPTGGASYGYRRAQGIRPSDIVGWPGYLTRAATHPVVLPKLALEWDVEVTPDFLNDDCVALHIALENKSEDPATNETETAVFQVQLEVSLPQAGHRALMLDRVKPSYRYYRYLAYPALGYNAGVVSRLVGEQIVLTTTWAPRFTLPRLEPRSLPGIVTNLEALSKPDCIAGLLALPAKYETWLGDVGGYPFAEGIAAADIDLIARERTKFEADLRNWGRELEAIRVGIAILERSRAAWSAAGPQGSPLGAPFEAWLAMNEAMAGVGKAKGYEDWRLFQLAFILATLPALVTRIPEFHDFYTPQVAESSNAVTLLYFATGGGKSEAFFGLLMYALFLDRLRGKERGITALVRYPLRLLTLQQAKRTAVSLAQAELVRRRRNHPGEPFSIGFWVGSSNTPNSLRDEEVRALPDVTKHPAAGEPGLLKQPPYLRALEKWNKLTRCPFCGGPTGLRRFPARGGMVGHLCLTDSCEWHHPFTDATPLPFFIVDDDIYDFAPTVLLGTVDKLALLGQSQRTIRRFLGMFGFAPGYIPATERLYAPDHRATGELSMPKGKRPFAGLFPIYQDGEKRYFDPFPALLIQDEAHLLDESLGTFAGLFETAMDTALGNLGPLLGDQVAFEPGSRTLRRIKIVAASATVADPERQMRNIYQRATTIQFPYPGPDLYTSFYAQPRRRPPDEVALLGNLSHDTEQWSHWSRIYCSILTNGHTHTVTVVETLAHFHTTITELFEAFRSGDVARVQTGKRHLLATLSDTPLTPSRRRAVEMAEAGDIATLLDLHRIALTYVTNKKGGDQIIAAESTEFDKKHRARGFAGYRLDTALITGAVDAGHIQAVIDRAEARAAVGATFSDLNDVLRSIVATSAVSHGVDVEELNSMFFAGVPSDVAEYIQASSRVGRAHVGFCVLLPTPHRARDRYIVEVQDIFHRFLERMIVPAAIDRWAEKAVERVVASFLQTYLCGLRAIRATAEAADGEKGRQRTYRLTQDAKDMAHEPGSSFKRDVGDFIEGAVGLRSSYAPQDADHYRGLIRMRLNDIFDDMELTRFSGSELRKFLAQRNVELRPMLSLRDVDKPGRIVPSDRDGRDRDRVNDKQITRAMRFIRRGTGATIDDDEETAEE